MKQDDIVVMAVNAGANYHFVKHHIAFIEAFAKLVEERTAAKERADEREACAKVCEQGEFMTFQCAAAAIRARGETTLRGEA